MSQDGSVLQQLLDLHSLDQEILQLERELRQKEEQLASVQDGVAGLESRLQSVDGELQRARAEARASERAVEEKRAQLDRVRSRVDNVQNQKQYSAATLEYDLLKRDLRTLEDQVIDKLQAVEDLESRQSGVKAELDVARSEVGPLAEDVDTRRKTLEEDLAIKRDRRHNLVIRLDDRARALYERILSGRSEVALAPLTEEGVCGHCYTSVTVQQEMQIREMSALVTCEGCGVILYPEGLKR